MFTQTPILYLLSLLHCLVFLIFFFFFQAEDGIRDKLVTGVQTCALPIWIIRLSRRSGRAGRIAPWARSSRRSGRRTLRWGSRWTRRRRTGPTTASSAPGVGAWSETWATGSCRAWPLRWSPNSSTSTRRGFSAARAGIRASACASSTPRAGRPHDNASPGERGTMADGSGLPSEMSVIEDAERRGRPARWPFWRSAYAPGGPLPPPTPQGSRATYRFDEGEPLPHEYKELLIKMLRHEGERAGNKSFLGFMATCLDIAEALFPTAEAKLLKAEYLAEELKHAIMFHRIAVGLQHDFALRDMFGRSDSRNAPKFIQWGLKGVDNAEIRQAYKGYVDRKLVALGLEPPDERTNRRFL